MIKITNGNGFIRFQKDGHRVEFLPKGGIRFGYDKTEIVISMPTGFNKNASRDELRFDYSEVSVPVTGTPEQLITVLMGYQQTGNIADMTADIDDMTADLEEYLAMNRMGSVTNLPNWITSRYYSSTFIFTGGDADIVAYSMLVISDLGANQFVQIHPCNPILAVTAIADDGGGDCRVTIPGHTYTGAETLYFQDITGTPLLNGLQAIVGVGGAPGAEWVDINVVFVADVTDANGKVTEEIADGEVPLVTLPVGEALFHSFGNGRRFANGYYVCNSSTADTKTLGADDLWIDLAWYPKS